MNRYQAVFLAAFVALVSLLVGAFIANGQTPGAPAKPVSAKLSEVNSLKLDLIFERMKRPREELQKLTAEAQSIWINACAEAKIELAACEPRINGQLTQDIAGEGLREVTRRSAAPKAEEAKRPPEPAKQPGNGK